MTLIWVNGALLKSRNVGSMHPSTKEMSKGTGIDNSVDENIEKIYPSILLVYIF